MAFSLFSHSRGSFMVKHTPVSTSLWRSGGLIFSTSSPGPRLPLALNCVWGSSVHRRRTPATSWIRSHNLASDPPSKRFPGKIQLAQHTSWVWLETSIQINFSLEKKLLLFKQVIGMNCFGFLSNYLLKSKTLICMLKYNGLHQCGPGSDSSHPVRQEISRWSSQFDFRGTEFWTAEKFNGDFITTWNIIRELSLPTCMPKAEENAKLLIFFPFGRSFWQGLSHYSTFHFRTQMVAWFLH